MRVVTQRVADSVHHSQVRASTSVQLQDYTILISVASWNRSLAVIRVYQTSIIADQDYECPKIKSELQPNQLMTVIFQKNADIYK